MYNSRKMCVYVCMLQALACMYYMHKWSKYVLWQRFWLDLCTKQVVSARACAYQFLPFNSLEKKLRRQ